MKRKPRSIRFKFFAAISAVALVFIGVLLLLNVFFFSDYYMMMRRSELRDAYRSIRSSYDRNADGIATILDNYESQTAIRLAVIRADGTVLYTSFWSMDEETQDPFQLPDPRPVRAAAPRIHHPAGHCAERRSERAAQPGIPAFQRVARGQRPVSVSGRRAGRQRGQMPVRLYALRLYPAELLAQPDLPADRGRVRAADLSGVRLPHLAPVHAAADRHVRGRGPHERAGLSTKYEGSENDEIGRLGQSLNRLSAYLEQTIGELRQTNAQLAQEIREKERVDNMRREFIVNVSHELKTPIALIQGYAEGLTAGVADDPEDRKYYCDTIADEADRMNKLVMQLLSLSRLELGAEQTYAEDIDLYALCSEAVRKTAVLCEGRGLTVRYEETRVTVRTDGDLLEQVLMNYLSNAIRYTADGGRIEISAARTGSTVRLTVFNEGDGLPEEELPRIWEKFYRTDRARTRAAGGTGIGPAARPRDRGYAARQLRRAQRAGRHCVSGLSCPTRRTPAQDRRHSKKYREPVKFFLTTAHPCDIVYKHLEERYGYRGVEQLVARRAHNPEVAGSSPVPATTKKH